MAFIGESCASARMAQEWRKVVEPLLGILTPALVMYLRTSWDISKLLRAKKRGLLLRGKLPEADSQDGDEDSR